MNLVSLCSGYGGLDLAVEAAFGATTVAYSEIEDAPSQVFARHWPDARPLGDLTAVDWTTVDADIVCAGFPCQDLSYAGKGRGIVKDSRSGLWYAIEHALGVVRPRWVVLENVSAIVARRPGLDVVLAGLASLGFDAEWTCVRASDVGAPHRRERWFLVAHADGERLRAGGGRLREPSSSVEGEAREREWCGDAVVGGGQDAPDPELSGLQGSTWRGMERTGESSESSEDAADSDRCGRIHRPSDLEPTEARVNALGDTPAGGLAPSDAAFPERRGTQQQHMGAPTGSTSEPRERAGETAWGEFAPAIARWERTIGRPAPAPTDDRGRLNPPFVEWMMGLPAGWVTDTPGLSRSQQLKALGNGVVPQQAGYAITALLDVRKAA